MSEEIIIIKNNEDEFNVVQGPRTIDLIDRQTKLDNDEKKNFAI